MSPPPAAPPPPGRNPHLVGIGLFLVAILLINCSDTAAKLAVETISAWQVTLIQGLGLVCASLVAARSLDVPRIARTSSLRLQLLRSSCQLASALCYFTGLALLPLADIIAIILIGPLVVTALAAVALKETVGPRRWAACVVGLVGALVVIRPGGAGMGWAALWPLGCVFFYSVYVVITRHLAATDRTATLMFWGSLVGVVVLAATAPLYWVWPEPEVWLALAAMAFFSGTSNGLRIRALGYAPASVLAPFGYAEIVGGTAAGLLVFGDFPDGWTWAGIAIIVASGLYVWHRERSRARP